MKVQVIFTRIKVLIPYVKHTDLSSQIWRPFLPCAVRDAVHLVAFAPAPTRVKSEEEAERKSEGFTGVVCF